MDNILTCDKLNNINETFRSYINSNGFTDRYKTVVPFSDLIKSSYTSCLKYRKKTYIKVNTIFKSSYKNNNVDTFVKITYNPQNKNKPCELLDVSMSFDDVSYELYCGDTMYESWGCGELGGIEDVSNELNVELDCVRDYIVLMAHSVEHIIKLHLIQKLI